MPLLLGKKTEVEERLLLVRTLENRLQDLCLQGLAGDLHFSKGQEAISVGVCSVLRPTDYVVTHHRTIAHALAKGVPLKPLVAELLGRASGINSGTAGEMHISYPDARFMFSFQLVGTCIPVAAGLAWAVKYYHKTDDVVVVFHGDAATANGQWHEGMNLAAVQNVPLLVVCENNHLAGNVRSEHYQPVPYVSDRISGYGILSLRVDGNNLDEVIGTAHDAVELVRKRSAPVFLECDTTRLGRHKQGQGDLRDTAEMAILAQRDPLLAITLTSDLQQDIETEVAEAIQEALAGPVPGEGINNGRS